MDYSRTNLIPGAAVLLAALLCVAGCQPRTEEPATPDRAQDEAAIRAVLDGIATDFSAGRIEEMFSYYQDDVLISAPGAPEVIGKQAWREALDATLPKDVEMGMVFNTAELEVSGDLAYERGTYAIRIGDPATPAQSMTMEGRHIHIFKRQPDGSWKGWRLMENSADPATAPIPPASAPAPAAGG